MKAYAGFVKDVHHTCQACPYLSSQTDSLRLAAREGIGAAIESEVVESYKSKETKSGFNLLDDIVSDKQ